MLFQSKGNQLKFFATTPIPGYPTAQIIKIGPTNYEDWRSSRWILECFSEIVYQKLFRSEVKLRPYFRQPMFMIIILKDYLL
jgi:hypothetical protein